MQARSALAASVLISLAVHASFVWLQRSERIRLGHGGQVDSGAAVMSVRVITAAEPTRQFPESIASSPVDGPTTALVVRPAAAPDRATIELEPAHIDSALDVGSREPAAAVNQTVTTVSAGVEYVPRAMLSDVPEPIKPLSVHYPRNGPAEGTFTTVLALFINEEGEVVRVRTDGATLPLELDTAAREAFLSARWRPGRMEGRLVKSLIHVEVMFQSGNAVQTIRSVD